MTPAERSAEVLDAARAVARHHALRESVELGRSVAPEELLGEAWLGATRAATTWDPSGGVRLFTWAAIGARSALRDERLALGRRPLVGLLEAPAVVDRPSVEQRDSVLAAIRRAASAPPSRLRRLRHRRAVGLTPGRIEALVSWAWGERNVDGAARVGRTREAFLRQRQAALAGLGACA